MKQFSHKRKQKKDSEKENTKRFSQSPRANANVLAVCMEYAIAYITIMTGMLMW